MLCLFSGTESLQNQTFYLPCYIAISLNMAVKKNSTKPVDPSNFLWASKWETFKARGAPFDFNSQQDVVEILQVFLVELKGVSLATSDLTSNTPEITVSCNTCQYSLLSDEKINMLTLPVSADMQTSSLHQFLSPEILSSQNKFFCPSCSTLSESTRETCLSNFASILSIQLCQFYNEGSQLVKDERDSLQLYST